MTTPPEESARTDGDAAATRRRWIVVVVVLVAVLVAAGVALAGVEVGRGQSTPAGTISVTGSGSVKGTPDTVSFQVGASTTAPSAAAALDENNTRVRSLERTLVRFGVRQKDMQTSGLNIYEDTTDGVVTGFTVNDTLNVSIHSIKRAGAALDAAVRVVGNGVQLDGVTFSIANDSNLLAAARSSAMHNAHTTASQVATGGGATLGRIVRVVDQENSNPAPIYFNGLAAVAAEPRVPLQPGSQTVSVQVTVVYALSS